MASGAKTVKKILRYVLLPEILPRIRALGASGFGYAAFLMAQVYRSARLLPDSHPYLNPANIGKFGLRHVIGEAGRNVQYTRKHIDQVAIHGCILVGIAILVGQVFLLGMAIFMQAAHAFPGIGINFIYTEYPRDDIAFILMDRIFGIPDFFNSCVATGVPCFSSIFSSDPPETSVPPEPYPFPFHFALHAMLQFYSIGLLVIAMVIMSYYLAAIFIETAEHGTPFGKRFNQLWTPIRLVAAFALLIPIAYGMNAAQWITLYAAKWGSGFATNGWTLFIDAAIPASGYTLLGARENMVATPNVPPVNSILEFGLILATCISAEESMNKRDIKAWVILPEDATVGRLPLEGSSYEDVLQQSKNKDILYRFGIEEEDKDGNPVHTEHEGDVSPTCGEVVLKVTDIDDVYSPGSQHILRAYHTFMMQIWEDARNGGGAFGTTSLQTMGQNLSKRILPRATVDGTPEDLDADAPLPRAEDLTEMRNRYMDMIFTAFNEAAELQANSTAWQFAQHRLGWGGAGIWYNELARLNGALVSAVYSMPSIKLYPAVMEFVKKEHEKDSQELSGTDRFKPVLSNGQKIVFNPANDGPLAHALYRAHEIWRAHFTVDDPATGNPVIDTIKMIFGVEGLFNMAENTHVHPLAQLAGIGKSLVESAVRNLAFSFGGAAVGTVLSGNLVGKLGMTVSSFSTSIAIVGLTNGFILFYVIPFLPFIYFFFAVAGWVKGIFEAIVGVPLWALAHLRIDGHTFMSDASKGGYYLILEIFIRPILTVFGLLAAIIIFATEVKILHEIWPLVTSNITGQDRIDNIDLADGELGSMTYLRSVADRFFYTVIYAIIVYMLGMAAFKLIDQVPNNILRFMGANVQSFNDQRGDPAQGLIRNLSFGSQRIGAAAGQIAGHGQQFVGHAAQGLASRAGGDR